MPECFICPARFRTKIGLSSHLLFHHGKFLEPCTDDTAKKRCRWRTNTNRWNKKNPEKRKENARKATRKYREKMRIAY